MTSDALHRSAEPTGFAPAAGPVQATAITTDTAGLVTADVLVPTGNGDLPLYFVAPEGKGPFPVILVVHEIFGVHEHIRDVARRLAKEGYLALAPELFFRYGDARKAADIAGAVREIAAKVPDHEVLADLDSVIHHAPEFGGDPNRAGITGFCWGGRISWLYAAHNSSIKAGAAWYGRLSGEPTANAPRFPLDIAPVIEVPVLGLYGSEDSGIPLDSVERMRAALKSSPSQSEIIVYDGAPHAFHADYRPSYREGPAKDGWRRLLSWFRSHGL
jgi:carboxymethylenebutenolidase